MAAARNTNAATASSQGDQRCRNDLSWLAVLFDGVGNVDRLLEGAHQGFSDGGFTVAGGAVNQHRAPRVGRRPEPAHDVGGQHQMRHRLLEFFDADHLVGDGLFLHLVLIGLQRYRHRADILAAPQSFAGALLAGVGQGVAHDVVVLLGRAANLDQGIFLGEFEQLVDHSAGQHELAGQLGNGLERRDVHGAQQTIEEKIAVQTGGGDGFRHLGGFQDHRFELFAGQIPQGDQIVAESAAGDLLLVQHMAELLLGNYPFVA